MYAVRVCVFVYDSNKKMEWNKMRHASSNRRQRKRSNGHRSNQNRMQVYDSNGPDVRIRGTAHQVAEKYEALAKDAMAAGNHVVAEGYLQHAEHYLRIINALKDAAEADNKNVQGSEAKETSPRNRRSQKEDNDLSLPSSILGDGVNSGSEKVVTA